jgi:hypothetical protein
MQIDIEFTSTAPPEGRTCRHGHRDWLPFAGWLELISAIERHLEAGARPLPAIDGFALGSPDPEPV